MGNSLAGSLTSFVSSSAYAYAYRCHSLQLILKLALAEATNTGFSLESATHELELNSIASHLRFDPETRLETAHPVKDSCPAPTNTEKPRTRRTGHSSSGAHTA